MLLVAPFHLRENGREAKYDRLGITARWPLVMLDDAAVPEASAERPFRYVNRTAH